jgi:redox-sensitive bicupin YhaK (pirin superfamily)
MSTNFNIVVHRANERGGGEYSWLKTKHSFSFGQWYDPNRMGFGALRVLNDDVIAPQSGFDTHPHKNMEIITIVTKGELTHRDSMGTVGHLTPKDVQVMSAGSGVLHSEYNENDEPLSLFQLWIMPNVTNIPPRYEERSFGDQAQGERLLVAPIGTGTGVLEIHQDAYISEIVLDTKQHAQYTLKDSSHGVYFFVVSGTLQIEGNPLEVGDALGIEHVTTVTLTAEAESKVLVIEVPMH